MFDKKVIDLPLEERTHFFYRTGKIKTLSKEIARRLDYVQWKKIDVKESFLIPENLKVKRDINPNREEEMRKEIESSTHSQEEKMRLWNLYLGMKYVLAERNISKENLRALYQIISQNIIPFEEKSMGEFYRRTREYICHHQRGPFPDFSEAVSPEHVDDYMNHYFDYVKKDENLSKVDRFLKSQIMHLYFVYVHPYLDGNGRSARLVSSWYLLNNGADEFLLFNKAISSHKEEYRRMVRKSIETKDFTHYLLFIMEQVKKELEKICTIEEVNETLEITLSHAERQILDIVLSLKEATLKNIIDCYRDYDPHIDEKKILKEKIIPMFERGILKEENGFIKMIQLRKKANQYGG